MSFTCTRYQDSIPCEASPNYFYLNKRNGDPKAYFLTEEDIIKPTNIPKHPSSISNVLPPSETNNPVMFRAQLVPRTPAASRDHSRSNTLVEQPMESTTSFGPSDNEYESNLLLEDKTYHPKASPPYQMNVKHSSKQFKSGVRYNKSRYEPVKKALGYDLSQTNRRSVSDLKSGSHMNNNDYHITNKAQYRSLVSNYRPSTSTKIDQILSNFDSIDNNKNSYSYSSDMKPKLSKPISIISPNKNTPFTPAAFSRMYMENQKTSKYTQDLTNLISPTLSSVHDYGKNTEVTDSYFPRQKLLESQLKRPIYYSFTKPIANSAKETRIPIAKYEPTEKSTNINLNLIKSNQFVVPTSVRVIESDRANKGQTEIHEPGSTNSNEPVKISFINNYDKHQSSVGNDFGGDLRVVKQVKGKNLLIDPSLENDPARDNIIAQVLEMLNKYN